MLSDIKEIITLFNESEIKSLKLKNESFTLHLEKDRENTPALIAQSISTPLMSQPISIPTSTSLEIAQLDKKSGDFITSPMVGTFYRSPSPGASPYVSVGDMVKKGQIIGIVEAMKIMNEIEADFDCKVISIEVNDAQPVEYGSKLVMVEKL